MDPRSPQPTRARVDGLLVALFLAALAAPWVDELVRPFEARSPEHPEMRAPAKKPTLSLDLHSLWNFPSAYESWFSDSFGLRDKLLRWHSLECLDVFHTSPTTKVLLGKGNWLFYTGDESVPVWRGLLPFREEDLQRWKQGLEARRDWLRSMGIEYLFVIAPNKESIYPDYLPDWLEQVGPTRLDQLDEYLAQHSDLDFLDLREAFKDERKHDADLSHVYLEEGTHWNGRGTLRAYREIVSRLARKFPELAPLPDERLVEVVFSGLGDSWGRNMYIEDLRHQREVAYTPPPGTAASHTMSEGSWGRGRKFVRGTGVESDPRAMFFHDSFGPYVETLLAEHFSQLECHWSYEFETTPILDLKPKVVIELWVERALLFYDPHQLEPHVSEPVRATFERAKQVCLVFDPSTKPPALEALRGMQLSTLLDEQGAGVSIQSSTQADSLLLPPLTATVKDQALVHVVIDSPQKGRCDVFFLREGDTEYNRRNNCPIELEQGHNDLYLRLAEKGITGKLRLRPEFRANQAYVLRAFEVRSLVEP